MLTNPQQRSGNQCEACQNPRRLPRAFQRARFAISAPRPAAARSGSARGYEPSTFNVSQEGRTSASAAATAGSRSWPSMSTKNTYSHGRRRDGRLSIFAHVQPALRERAQHAVQDAGLVARHQQQRRLVAAGRLRLLAPDRRGTASCCARGPRCCGAATTRSYRRAAISTATAAPRGSSCAWRAPSAVERDSTTVARGRFAASQRRHCPAATGIE